tara:strand:- start:113 stop:499 length:387 start_codon:yes stop_codon:yes gene_type:complete
MIEYFLLGLLGLIFLYSNFVHLFPQREMMIAFVGKDHPRLFEKQYITSDADLFVFRNRASNSINVKYKKKGTEHDYFEKSDYNYMLIVHMLHFYVPIDHTPKTFIHNNKTVAELYVKKNSLENRKIFI